MNVFAEIFSFLERLNANNSKEWMDAHRDEYHRIRDGYIKWLNDLDKRLIQVDPDYFPTEGRRAIHRINNNLMFHPDKPVYKSHFGATMDRVKGKSDFYIHLGHDECFIAGGYYHPSSRIVNAVREAIDYDGEVLRKIVNRKAFRETFGDLYEEDALKTSPKDYEASHEHIDLLRLKSYAVEHPLSRSEIMSSGFADKVVELYRVLMPFRNYLNRAVMHAEETQG
ncbi:MAG: DUF2461 domain-containing protein [Cyclobacteriaceae bacterium]